VEQSGVKWRKQLGKGVEVLLGTHTPKLDEKGRLILPAKFRDELGEGVVITRGQERCLYVFSSKEFTSVHDKIRQAPVTNEEARRYLRVFLSGATDETPDTPGRVLLPQLLRDYANLSKELVIIGVGARAEIWDAQTWNDYLARNEDGFSSQAEEVIPGLF
jgi:MraZ protein